MSGECDQCGEHVMDCECFPRAVKCPFCGFPLKQSEKHADGWYWHPPRSRRDMNCPFSAKRDKHGFYNSFFVKKRHAITAGTRSAKTTSDWLGPKDARVVPKAIAHTLSYPINQA